VRPRRRLAAAALAAALAGCARAPPPDLSRDPAQLLEAVRTAQGRVLRVKGSARVRVESPGASGTVDELVAAEKPDRLRLETLDFFGNVATVLVADGKRFALYDARDRVLYRGDAKPENVSRLLPLTLSAEEIATVLCGSAPLSPSAPISAEPDGALLVLALGSTGAGQRLGVGAEAAVEWSRLRRAAAPGPALGVAPDYDLAFDVFRHRGGARFPTEVELRAPSARVRVALRWKDDLEVNGAAEGGLFRLEPPRGARVVDLPPGGAAPAAPLPFRPSGE